MRQALLFSALVLSAALASPPAAAQSRGGDWNDGRGWYGHAGDGRDFRCESVRGRARYCAVPGRGDVRLLRQLSSTPCIEGRTWGRERGGVWVDRGCRAEFRWSPGRGWGRWHGRDGDYGRYRQTLRCESSNGRDRYCRAEIYRGVQLQRQLSSAACVEGRTWGWDRGGVWVDRGCRGEFAIW